MANTLSASKRHRQAEGRRQRNKSILSGLRNHEKSCRSSIEAGTISPGDLSRLYSLLDKAVNKGAIHRNEADRKKSRFNTLWQANGQGASESQRSVSASHSQAKAVRSVAVKQSTSPLLPSSEGLILPPIVSPDGLFKASEESIAALQTPYLRIDGSLHLKEADYSFHGQGGYLVNFTISAPSLDDQETKRWMSFLPDKTRTYSCALLVMPPTKLIGTIILQDEVDIGTEMTVRQFPFKFCPSRISRFRLTGQLFIGPKKRLLSEPFPVATLTIWNEHNQIKALKELIFEPLHG